MCGGGGGEIALSWSSDKAIEFHELHSLACNKERAFFASEELKNYDLWTCQKVTDALIYLLDNIY